MEGGFGTFRAGAANSDCGMEAGTVRVPPSAGVDHRALWTLPEWATRAAAQCTYASCWRAALWDLRWESHLTYGFR